MIPCDLCALDCGTKPFALDTSGGTLNFCCEGCRGIYEMLNEINSSPGQPAQTIVNSTERKTP